MKKKTHEEKRHGWTSQKSWCDYAVWWDCSFACSFLRLQKQGMAIPCVMNIPDYRNCPKWGGKSNVFRKEENMKVKNEKVYEIFKRILHLDGNKGTIAYGQSYANAGIGLEGEALEVQVLYVLNNLSSWRGQEAREAKELLKQYAKERGRLK